MRSAGWCAMNTDDPNGRETASVRVNSIAILVFITTGDRVDCRYQAIALIDPATRGLF
jgi:hypothetical protein